MKYSILLFDIDDTILDFQANQERALPLVFNHFGFEAKPEYLAAFRSYNAQLWRNYEVSCTDFSFNCSNRFSTILSDFGFSVDGPLWEACYEDLLSQGADLMPHAREVLSALSQRSRLFVISNGIPFIQKRRLKLSGLQAFFEDKFISMEMGVQKPKGAFFQKVADSIPDFSPDRTLVIGDSVNTDIKGSLDFGLDCCWYNSHGSKLPDLIHPTYTITDLTQLLSL